MAETQIKITADTRSAERAINNLESALEDIQRASDVAGRALAAVTAAAGAMAFAITRTVGAVGDLADAAKLFGMTAQSLQLLQQSAQLAGVGADELNGALSRMRANIGEALVSGTGAANDALGKLGINLTELSRLPADRQIALITERLRGIQNPAERAALSIDLLGKQGPRLLAVADNMARMEDMTRRLGMALSDLDVAAIEEAGDSLDDLTFIFQGALQQAAAAVAPYIVVIVERIKDAIEQAGGLDNVIRNKILPAIKLITQASIIFAGIWISGVLIAKIVAITNAIVRMYTAIKLATTVMEYLNAVMGKNPILKIVGLIAGLAGAFVAVQGVNKVFDDLDRQAQDILNSTNDKLQEQKANIDAGTEAVARQNKEHEKVRKALEDSISKLEQSVQYERDKATLGEATANAAKMIAEEERKLAEQKLKMTDSDKKRIQDAYAALEAVKQQVALTKVLDDLETERLGLAVADKDQREIVLAIRKQELDFGRQLNEEEKTRLSTAIKLTQQAREQAAIAETINNFTREQTELEKINRGINLQRTLGGGLAGGVTSEREYQRDQEALQALLDNKLISEQQYFQQREELARQYNLRVQELEMQRIERVLMAERSGMAEVMSEQDRAILKRVGENERQKSIVEERIKFEKMSEMQKAQFAIQQGAEVFSALGAQNKRAFEAAKAFNIANAVMNTYMAATKALATYPWPFGMIAAAAAVAAGLAQVAQIRSQTYSGRQLGGPVMGNQSYIVGENGPELFTPTTNGSITRNGDLGGGGQVNVNFTIVANDTTGFDQLLVSRRGIIQQVISDAMLERGRRSMV